MVQNVAQLLHSLIKGREGESEGSVDHNDSSESSVMNLLDFRVLAWVLLGKPLFRGVSCTRFLSAEPCSLVHRKVLVFVFTCFVCFAILEKDLFYSACGDLISYQNMLEEVHRALRILVVVNCGD